jgi:RES domain-containing protein
MHPDLLAAFGSIDVKNYVVEYPSMDTYVSYRYAPDPFGASNREARYNPQGVACFYIADSIETAQREVRFNFNLKELYHVTSGSFFAFNAAKFANDFSLSPMLTGAESDGGYEFCQELAAHVTGYGLSGVAYPSRQMALQGKTGMCMALLPQSWQLESGKLMIFEPPS